MRTNNRWVVAIAGVFLDCIGAVYALHPLTVND